MSTKNREVSAADMWVESKREQLGKTCEGVKGKEEKIGNVSFKVGVEIVMKYVVDEKNTCQPASWFICCLLSVHEVQTILKGESS